jgi:hypothetical protein
MNIRCELGAFPVVLRYYTLMFNYFLRFSESGGLMDGIHNILNAAFAFFIVNNNIVYFLTNCLFLISYNDIQTCILYVRFLKANIKFKMAMGMGVYH